VQATRNRVIREKFKINRKLSMKVPAHLTKQIINLSLKVNKRSILKSYSAQEYEAFL